MKHMKNFRRHMMDKHTNQENHFCRFCNKNYKTKNSMEKHQYAYHKEELKTMKTGLIDSWLFNRHWYSQELLSFIILINLCLDVFYQLDAQINTMMYKSDKAWHCAVCEKISHGKSNISRHIEATHLENHPGLNCDICGETVKSRNALRLHRAAKHRWIIVCCWCFLE